MKENAIISLADSNYYELLNELIDSIKQFNHSEKVAICILDAGLTAVSYTHLTLPTNREV